MQLPRSLTLDDARGHTWLHDARDDIKSGVACGSPVVLLEASLLHVVTRYVHGAITLCCNGAGVRTARGCTVHGMACYKLMHVVARYNYYGAHVIPRCME